MQHTVLTQSFVNLPHIDGEGGADIFPRRPPKRYSFQITGKLLTRHMWKAVWQNTKRSKGFNHASSRCVHFQSKRTSLNNQNLSFSPNGSRGYPFTRGCAPLIQAGGAQRSTLRCPEDRAPEKIQDA